MLNRTAENRVAPIFPSRNLDTTIAFYTELGFDLIARYDDVGYLILRLDPLEIHFFSSTATNPAQNDHGCYFHASNASLLRETWVAAHDWIDGGFPRLTEVERTDYGKLEFALVDRDGNLIRIGSDIRE